jgi:hypothetical protein
MQSGASTKAYAQAYPWLNFQFKVATTYVGRWIDTPKFRFSTKSIKSETT